MMLRRLILVAALCLGTAVLGTSVAEGAAKPAGPLLINCGPFAKAVKSKSGSAKQAATRKLRDCRNQNQARTIAARQIAGFGFVGARGDGMAVDWRQCSNGAWLHYSDGRHGRSRSDGKRWFVSHAIVRQGGRWFDAVVTGPVKGGRSEIGISRRGTTWQVSIASFRTQLSSPGEVKRSKVTNADCVAT